MSDVASVRLLGGFSASLAGRPVTVGLPVSRLVALLALRRRPLRRGEAAAVLWGDVPESCAGTNLRAVLCRMRRSAAAALVLDDGRDVALSDGVDVDVWHTDPALDALHLELLPDWGEEWLVADRERHRQRRLHRLERLCAEHRAAGRYADALEAGLAAVAGEPLRESAHRHVVAVHLAEQNDAEALRQYDAYRRLLRAELGLAPSPAIRGLVVHLLGRPAEVHR